MEHLGSATAGNVGSLVECKAGSALREGLKMPDVDKDPLYEKVVLKDHLLEYSLMRDYFETLERSRAGYESISAVLAA